MNSMFLRCIIIITSLISCQNKDKANLEIDGFSSELWINDSIACTGYRQSISEAIVANKHQILGKDSIFLLTKFGTPNIRGQRSLGGFEYVYYLECNRSVDIDSEVVGSLRVFSILFFRLEPRGLVKDLGFRLY